MRSADRSDPFRPKPGPRTARPARPALVAGLAGGLCLGVVLRFGLDGDAVLPLLLVIALAPIAAIDIDRRVIPNAITASAAAAGLAAALVVDPTSVPERLIAAGAAGGAFMLVWLVSPSGMGMGDVKLVAVLGLYLQASVVPAVFVALLAGTLAGAVVIARTGVRAGRRTTIAFGPFLVLGGLVGLFAGPQILDLYRQAL